MVNFFDLPVKLCPVYITGDGTFSKQILFTDTNGEATVGWTVSSTEGKNEFTATIYKADKTVIEEIAHSVNVVKEKTAPTVATLAATNKTTSSAKLQGNVTSDGNATIIQRGFYWSKTDQTPDAGDNKEIVNDTTVGTCQLMLNGNNWHNI